jgi:hypothetical protein
VLVSLQDAGTQTYDEYFTVPSSILKVIKSPTRGRMWHSLAKAKEGAKISSLKPGKLGGVGLIVLRSRAMRCNVGGKPVCEFGNKDGRMR